MFRLFWLGKDLKDQIISKLKIIVLKIPFHILTNFIYSLFFPPESERSIFLFLYFKVKALGLTFLRNAGISYIFHLVKKLWLSKLKTRFKVKYLMGKFSFEMQLSAIKFMSVFIAIDNLSYIWLICTICKKLIRNKKKCSSSVIFV